MTCTEEMTNMYELLLLPSRLVVGVVVVVVVVVVIVIVVEDAQKKNAFLDVFFRWCAIRFPDALLSAF